MIRSSIVLSQRLIAFRDAAKREKEFHSRKKITAVNEEAEIIKIVVVRFEAR